MTETVFTKVDYSLKALLEYIALGEIGLPDIQRPFVWPNIKVRDLFDSMYRGFPVGYLLFWSNGVGDHRQVGAEGKQKSARLLIVDGQQRLTSLYAVLKGLSVVREDFRKERIYIAFCPKTQTFAVADAALRRDPEYIPDISLLWTGGLSQTRFVKSFLENLRQHRPVDEAEEDQLSDTIDRLHDLETYPFTALELSSTINEEQVADVFVRINSKGTPLNQADFILTLMSVFWDEGRTELETFCRRSRTLPQGAPSPHNHFIQPAPDQMLRVSVGLAFRRARLQYVYSVLRGKDLQTGVFSEAKRDEQFAKLKDAQTYMLKLENWHGFLKAPLLAGFRSGSMITSEATLLYSYTLYLIGKRDFQVDEFSLRRAISRWFFMASLTGRYTNSPESTMEQDLASLRDVPDAAGFVSLLNRIVNDTLTEDFWNINLVNALVSSSARTPSLYAYYAALNLVDAPGLFSNIKVADLLDPTLRSTKSPLERHHLFPKGYLKGLGIEDLRETNQIANFTLVEWLDNLDILAESPAEYCPRYKARFEESDLSKMWRWHALPQGWEQLDYQTFLQARRKLMANVIRKGFEKMTP